MFLFVGLGNPGEKYEHSRHNAGWMYLDFMLEKLGGAQFSVDKKTVSEVAKKDNLLFVKPQTFMNDSGKAVEAVTKWYGGEGFETNQLYIIYDDLDIPLGKYKIQLGSGPKIHNGLNSIRDHLKTDQFWNVRVGVDNRNGDRSNSGSEYVLGKFNNEEKKLLNEVFEEVFDELTNKI
jgi:PTH1 family peptidyl-tRNA hydrolase